MLAKNKKNKLKRPRKKLNIRVNDEVQVIAGKDKGTVGKVVSVDKTLERIVVKGVNQVTRHVKGTGANQSGQIVVSEAPIHYSNVLLYSKHSERGVRVRIQKTDAGVRQRICTKTANIIE